MASLNKAVKSVPVYTHEGAKASKVRPEVELRRTVMGCLLWENSFYENGQSVADRIKTLVPKCNPYAVADMAVEAREDMKLRHVPLLLVREMARNVPHKNMVAQVLATVIQRPDELTEFLAIYWQDGKDQPISAQVKRGLAQAFKKFDAYQLAKYNRDGAIKLRDVLRLVHPAPVTEEQERTWGELIKGTLKAPDTWEVALSAGADKAETFTRLIQENKLGGMAFLRNLRNMEQAHVPSAVINEGFRRLKTDRILPYRFITAARYAPNWEPQLEAAMFQCVEDAPKLPGRTLLLVDVSGSMDERLSDKSEMTRLDAACGLAILLREKAEKVAVVTFSSDTKIVPARRGFALRDAIVNSQEHGGTQLGLALEKIKTAAYDRLIVLTDEQSHDPVTDQLRGKNYMVNVGTYQNGVGYGGSWTHIDGFSESILDYILEYETWERNLLNMEKLTML